MQNTLYVRQKGGRRLEERRAAFQRGRPPGPKRAEKPRFFRKTTGRMVWNAQRFKLFNLKLL